MSDWSHTVKTKLIWSTCFQAWILSTRPSYQTYLNWRRLISQAFWSLVWTMWFKLRYKKSVYRSWQSVQSITIWIWAWLCFLRGEYLVVWRDVGAILAAVQPHLSATDLVHIEWILRIGYPSKFRWEEPADNKELFIHCGNNPSVKANWQTIVKMLNKEEQNHQVIPFQSWVVRASLYMHHILQTIIVNEGPKDRLVWDGKQKKPAHEITINENTNTRSEAEIMFGYVYMALYIWIWTCVYYFHPSRFFLLSLTSWSAFVSLNSLLR